ncbi:MAG: bifunctional DNA-formamidopyrimidine glycosylase/DNA-(apurinic or apyrimidinic site) lyase [candidate division WOR-3 bacterium]|nr:bifunctional DNA-formamidopyrimidine glycosylase/DNA-(apurinic or apyrimidinic site) lyase [candidate division WOR-3 bacterium]
MPELPEVETIKRELKPLIINKKITKVKIIRPDIIGYPSVGDFEKGVIGKRITNLVRKAKYLIFELSNNSQMIIHLRLSGQLLVWENRQNAPKHERLRFYLSDKAILSFAEPRVLGRVYLVPKNKYPDVLNGLKTLGLEPIDRRFDYNYLYSKLKNRKATIKSLLLNQSITAGIGNIYSDEALFLAGIHPLRRANSLTETEIEKLSKSLKNVLRVGIKSKGTSVSDYLRPDGSEGKYQFRAFVFDREGEPCRICNTKIEFAKIGNRRTRFCPKCQPYKKGT